MRTPTDEELTEFLALKAAAKWINARIDEITETCRERGSFSTSKFVCTVSPQSRTGLAGLHVVEKAIGKEILERNNLINTTISLQVKVSPITKYPQLQAED